MVSDSLMNKEKRYFLQRFGLHVHDPAAWPGDREPLSVLSLPSVSSVALAQLPPIPLQKLLWSSPVVTSWNTSTIHNLVFPWSRKAILFLIFFNLLFIYLAASGLSCGTRDLCCIAEPLSLWCVGSVVGSAPA